MKKLLAVILVLLVAVGGYFIYDNATTKTVYNKCEKNESSVYLDFAPLNGKETYELYFKKGDVISFKWNISEGKIKIIMKAFDGEPIYEGNMQSGDFSIDLIHEGMYYVTITGKKATGTLEIVKK